MTKTNTKAIAEALGSNLDEAADPGLAAPSRRLRILLEENENIPPGGQFFGVNGRGYLLRPGEEAEVPEEVIEVLNNAIMSTPVLDGQQSVIGYRDKLRFPYRVLQQSAARA